MKNVCVVNVEFKPQNECVMLQITITVHFDSHKMCTTRGIVGPGAHSGIYYIFQIKM
jgi:hypothetical protein